MTDHSGPTGPTDGTDDPAALPDPVSPLDGLFATALADEPQSALTVDSVLAAARRAEFQRVERRRSQRTTVSRLFLAAAAIAAVAFIAPLLRGSSSSTATSGVSGASSSAAATFAAAGSSADASGPGVAASSGRAMAGAPREGKTASGAGSGSAGPAQTHGDSATPASAGQPESTALPAGPDAGSSAAGSSASSSAGSTRAPDQSSAPASSASGGATGSDSCRTPTSAVIRAARAALPSTVQRSAVAVRSCSPGTLLAVAFSASPRPVITVQISRAEPGTCGGTRSSADCTRLAGRSDAYGIRCADGCSSVWVYRGGYQVQVSGSLTGPRPWTDEVSLTAVGVAVLDALG